MTQIHIVHVLFTDGNSAIHVHPKKRQVWEVPAGHVDAGESYPEAAARELAEETGYHVSPAKMRHVLLAGPMGPTPKMIARGSKPGGIYWHHLFTATRADMEFFDPAYKPDPEEIEQVDWKTLREVREEVAFIRTTHPRYGELHAVWLAMWEFLTQTGV